VVAAYDQGDRAKEKGKVVEQPIHDGASLLPGVVSIAIDGGDDDTARAVAKEGCDVSACGLRRPDAR
jgi:hypothetical protein